MHLTRPCRYPVFLTACHMLACTLLGQGASMLGVYSLARIQSRRQLSKIAALAAIFCLSLVCGNASLRFLPVSFTQVCVCTVACVRCSAARSSFSGPCLGACRRLVQPRPSSPPSWRCCWLARGKPG